MNCRQYKDFLEHHGIKGMHWGVRRYQNKDGTLTAQGRKHLDYASKQASKNAEYSRNTAQDYRDDARSLERRYSGKDGSKKWLDDMYGDDWHNKKYMKDAFDVDDVEKHGREGAANEIKETKRTSERMYKLEIQSAKEWESKARKYMEATSVKDLSKDDLKQAKKLCKEYLRH